MLLLKRWLTPPIFKDEEKTHRAYLLHVILLALIAIPVPFVIYQLIFRPEEANRALVIIAPAEAINIILFVMLRRGFVYQASVMHIATLWLTFTVSSITSSSIYGVAYMLGNALVITIAGVLLGARSALAMTLLAIAQGGILVYAELNGWMPPDILDDPLATWIVIVVLFAIGMSLQNLSASEVRTALHRANASEERYRLISQVSSDYTFSTELDSKGNMHLSWVAGAFENISGYSFEEYMASGGWHAHLHPDDVEKDAQDTATLKTNKQVVTEIRTFKKNGDLSWVRVYAHPIWDDKQNRLTAIVGAVQDITNQKIFQESERNRREILEKVLSLGKQVTEVANLQTTLERIWHGVHDELGFDRVGIFSYNVERNSMDRMLGTDIHGERDDTPGFSVQVEDWKLFQVLLESPDRFYATHEYTLENNIPKDHEMYGVKDFASVAVWAGNKPVAAITVDQLITQHSITENQLEALRLFAGYAGLAIDNARLQDAIQNELDEKKQAEKVEQRRRQMLVKTIQLGKQVAEVADLQTTLERIWHALHDDLDFDRTGIFLYDTNTGLANRMLGTDIHGNMDKTPGETVPVAEWRSFKYVVEKPDGFYFTHNFSTETNIPEGHEMYEVKDYAIVAAWAGDKPVAIITVDQLVTQRTILDQQLEALQLFAGYAGLAIENARLKDAIQNELNEKKRAEETEQRRRVMLEKIVNLGQYVTEVQDTRTTLQRIWHTVRNELDFDRLGIYLYNPDNNTMNGSYGTSHKGEMLEEWDVQVPLTNENVERNAFWNALQEPNGMYITHNYEVEHNTPEGHIMYGVKDFAAVAAWAGNKPIAVICVDQQPTQRPITDYQLEMLRLFAGYAGLAIENSRLKDAIQNELVEQIQAEELEQRRRKMMEKVVQLGKQVTEVSDFRTTLTKIWHAIRYDLDFDRVGIFIYNPQDNTYDGTYGTGRDGKIMDAWHVRIALSNDSPFERSMVFHKVLGRPDGFYFTRDYENEFNIEKNEQMAGVKHYAVVAVWAGNKPVAIISVDQLITGNAFSDEQLEALRLFAGYAGLAIENSRLNDAIQNELVEKRQTEEVEQRRRIMLEKVVQLGKQVTEVNNFDTTMKKIWYGVRHDLDFDRTGLFLYNPSENIMQGAYGTDYDGNIWDAWHVRFELDEDALFYKVLVRPDGYFFTRDYGREFNPPPDHDMAGVKYCAMVAAWAGNKPVAIISVDQFVTGRVITDEQLEALRLFAGYAGLAISNAKLNDALENQLKQRQTFIDELETKNAELERFTYTVSHDLKSPLVTITGFLGYLEKDALSGNTEKIKGSVNRISNAAEKMQELLNDLLELSRIGRLMNPPEDIPFEEIVNEAVEHVQGRLNEKNVQLNIQKDLPTIHGDRARLVEVMQNLLDNAAKYSSPNIQPTIEVGSTQEQQGKIIYFVRDNGIGIEPQYHERIFGLFNKLNPHSEGTGIGLSLIKRIIEVHNGQIWVESEAGKGSTFYFTIPRTQ